MAYLDCSLRWELIESMLSIALKEYSFGNPVLDEIIRQMKFKERVIVIAELGDTNQICCKFWHMKNLLKFKVMSSRGKRG